MRVVTALLLALVAPVVAASTLRGQQQQKMLGSASDCSDSSYAIKFSSVTLTPDPPVLGQAAAINATGVASAAVTGGSLTLTVTFLGVPLFTGTANTCGSDTIDLPLGFGSVDINSLTCPAAAGGLVNVNSAITLPTAIPTGGQYQIGLQATNADGSNAYCINISFNE